MDQKTNFNPLAKLFQNSKLNLTGNTDKNPVEEDGHLIIDMHESDNSYHITAPAAGVKPEDIEIELNDDYIIIKGHRRSYESSATQNYVIQECYWGSFTRRVDFPETTNSADATATFKDGMLHITIPKSKSAKTRTLKIKTI